jgi:hypothetical protein
MKYCTVADDNTYFSWQIEVMIANFREVGINPNRIEIIILFNGDSPSEQFRAIQAKNTDVRFHFYKDERDLKGYIPSKKPYGMYKHLLAYPNLNDEPIFYHDSDMLFIKKINEKLLEDGDVWYSSNTDSYIAYDYVISKGVEQFYQMCETVGVSPDLVKHNDGGGAQYIIKKSTASYWLKVYEDSNKLYKLFQNSKNTGGIQVWTAEMWATLWVAYQFGKRVKNHKELDFIMGTNNISDIEKVKIYHNAGVTDKIKTTHFYKGEYTNQYPLKIRDTLKNDNSSWWYLQQIKKYI